MTYAHNEVGMEEKISVIIPVYNTAVYLEKCIQSVRNQTYSNLEIICIDDGSTDDSGAMLDDFVKRDKRIKVIHKENEGVAAARNAGLRVASGKWIGFVDSDDFLDFNMYETMLKANEQQGADMISCGYYFEYEDRCVTAENKKFVPTHAVATKSFLKYVYERDIYKGVACYLWTRLLRRELIYFPNNELKYIFPEDLDMSEDLVFLAEAMQDSVKSLYVEKPLYHYMQRESSACHDERKQLAGLSWTKGYLRIIQILKDQGVEEAYNLVIRMMVYRSGKLMELAIKYQDTQAYDWLKDVIDKYYDIYVMMNKEYPDRIEWIDSLLAEKQ